MTTTAQARALQAAVKDQYNQRNRLIAAGSDKETRDAADAYIAATDAAYVIASQVSAVPGLEAMEQAMEPQEPTP